MKKIRILVGSHAGPGAGDTTGQSNWSAERCLLCGNNGGSSSTRRLARNNDYCGKLALKMLMRYLSIDVSKAFPNPYDDAAVDGKGVWEGHHQNEEKLEEMARTLCDRCEANVAKFWEVYQNLEVVRLQLEQSLHQIKDHLESSKTKDNYMTEKNGTLNREVVRKCTLKLGFLPRVRMGNVGRCFKNVNVPTSGVANIGMREENEHDESVPIIKQEDSDTGSTNNNDSGDGYEDHPPASPGGPLSGPQSSSSECDSENSIENSCSKNVNVHGVLENSMPDANECLNDESAPRLKHEEPDTGSTSNNDDDDEDYTPGSPEGSLSDTSSESDSGKPETTLSIPEKATHPSTSTATRTSCPKLKRLAVANRTRKVFQRCRICGKYFSTPKALNHHMQLHTKAVTRKSIKCSYCPQVSNDTLEHQQHILWSHPIEFMGSDLPAGTTKQKLNLVLEQMLNQCDRVLVNENESFRCSICNSVLTNVFDWRVHAMETHISNIVTTLQNQQWEIETFGTEPERSLSGSKSKICLHCGKCSTSRENHVMHMKHVHPFEYYPIPAGVNINERNFMKCLSSAFEQIVKTVVNKKIRWKCPLCPTSFCKRTTCRMHMCRKHLEAILSGLDASPKRKSPNPNQRRKTNLSRRNCAKKSKCDYCECVYSDAKQVRNHSVKHHCYEYLSDQVGHFPSYVTEANLELAIETMFEEAKLATSENSVRYQCPLCKGSKLYRTWRFRNHIFSGKHLKEVLSLLIKKIENSRQATRDQRAASGDLDDHDSPTERSKLSEIKIVTDVAPVNPVTCVYCGTVTRDKHRYREHLRRRHSYYYYNKKLPNVSEKAFNRTWKAMLSESRLNHATSTGKYYKCILCKVMKYGKHDMKDHLLAKGHFPEVLSRLNSKTDKATGVVSGDSEESDSVSSGAESTSAVKSSSVPRNCSSKPKLSPCRVCKKVFLNQKTLLLHMSCHTNTLASRECTYCSQTFNDPFGHQQHVFCNHAELFFAEELPTGTTRENLESVLQRLLGVCDRVGENNTESVNCSMCHTPVGNPLQWRVHLLETHLPTLIEVLENKVEITNASRGLDSVWRCKYCGKVSTTSSMHRMHLKSVHSFKTYFHKFPPGTNVSEQAFTQSLLNACSLVVKVEVNNKTRLQCPFCPMTVGSRGSCKPHICDQHLTAVISAAAETSAMKPNGDRSLRHKFRPSKNRKKKGKEYLCVYKPCGKVFGSYVGRLTHSISHHPFQHLNHLNKLPKGTCEKDLLITIERMVEEARLPSSVNGLQYQCTMCKPARLFSSNNFRAHLLSQSFHLLEVFAQLPKRRLNNSNSATNKVVVSNPIRREEEKEDDDDEVITLKGEDDIYEDGDEDEMDVPSFDPLTTTDFIHGDSVRVAEDEDMELE